jgi:hypothetical protein
MPEDIAGPSPPLRSKLNFNMPESRVRRLRAFQGVTWLRRAASSSSELSSDSDESTVLIVSLRESHTTLLKDEVVVVDEVEVEMVVVEV